MHGGGPPFAALDTRQGSPQILNSFKLFNPEGNRLNAKKKHPLDF